MRAGHFLDPSPAEEEERSPDPGRRASLGSVFPLLSPSFKDAPPCACRVFLRGARAAPAGPAVPKTLPAAPEPPLLPAMVPGRGSGPGQGPGRFPRQGWRPPQLRFPFRSRPVGLPRPRRPSAESDSPGHRGTGPGSRGERGKAASNPPSLALAVLRYQTPPAPR